MCYPVQILAAFDIIEQNDVFRSGRRRKLKVVVMRSTIIVLITIVALIIPDFAVFLNIVGAICCTIVAFVLPPILYNMQFKR